MRKSLLTLTAATALVLAGCGGTDASAPATSAPQEGGSAAAGGWSEADAVDGITIADGVATVKIGATPVPHADILNFINEKLAGAANLKIEVVEFTDYQLPNSALQGGDIAGNFYQTPNFLAQQENEKGYTFEAFSPGVHVEPLGFYSDKHKKIEDLPNGATIAINNDPANTARALKLLADNKLIKLADVELPTDTDITENPKNLKFQLVDGAQTARALADVDAAVINGNYAIEAGKVPAKDALALEAGENSPYSNLLVVREADAKNAVLVKLNELLTSPEVKEFITSKWNDGSVIPAF